MRHPFSRTLGEEPFWWDSSPSGAIVLLGWGFCWKYFYASSIVIFILCCGTAGQLFLTCFFFFFFPAHIKRQVEIPRPGNELVLQQWSEALQWQRWIINPLVHKWIPCLYVCVCVCFPEELTHMEICICWVCGRRKFRLFFCCHLEWPSQLIFRSCWTQGSSMDSLGYYPNNIICIYGSVLLFSVFVTWAGFLHLVAFELEGRYCNS